MARTCPKTWQVKEMLRGDADKLSSKFHLSYNMLLNCTRVEVPPPLYCTILQCSTVRYKTVQYSVEETPPARAPHTPARARV